MKSLILHRLAKELPDMVVDFFDENQKMREEKLFLKLHCKLLLVQIQYMGTTVHGNNSTLDNYSTELSHYQSQVCSAARVIDSAINTSSAGVRITILVIASLPG